MVEISLGLDKTSIVQHSAPDKREPNSARVLRVNLELLFYVKLAMNLHERYHIARIF